jgi:very-short-patch-repair endonuclease
MNIVGIGNLISKIGTLGMKKYVDPRRNKIIRNGKTIKPIFSKEHKENLSKAHLGNKSALGHKVTKKARKAMSIGHTGKVANETTKQRMSLVHKGVVLGSPPKERRIRIRKSVLVYYAKDPANKMKCAHPMTEKGRLANIAAHTGKKHHLGMKHTQKTRDKIKQALRNPELIRLKASRGHIFVSKPENVFASILDNIGIKYERQYPITDIVHVYPCDFYIDKYKMVIEIDGLYWHHYPDGNEIDHIRNNEMKNAGYHVIRFWEDEIKNAEYIEYVLNGVISRIDKPSNIIPFPMVS